MCFLQNGLSALHMATQGGHVEVVELLLKEDFPVDDITSVSTNGSVRAFVVCMHVWLACWLQQ